MLDIAGAAVPPESNGAVTLVLGGHGELPAEPVPPVAQRDAALERRQVGRADAVALPGHDEEAGVRHGVAGAGSGRLAREADPVPGARPEAHPLVLGEVHPREAEILAVDAAESPGRLGIGTRDPDDVVLPAVTVVVVGKPPVQVAALEVPVEGCRGSGRDGGSAGSGHRGHGLPSRGRLGGSEERGGSLIMTMSEKGRESSRAGSVLTSVTVSVVAVCVTLTVCAGTVTQEQAEVMREAGYVTPLVMHLGGAGAGVGAAPPVVRFRSSPWNFVTVTVSEGTVAVNVVVVDVTVSVIVAATTSVQTTVVLGDATLLEDSICRAWDETARPVDSLGGRDRWRRL